MSSASNPNSAPGNTPGSTPGNTPKRPEVSPTDPTRTQWPPVVPAPAPPPASANDPTLTQWPPAAPAQEQAARATPPSQGPARTPPAAPNDPTLTQWAYPAQAEPLAPPIPPQEAPVAPKAGRRGPRSLFWPGFAAAFLLLSALSCGALTAALGLNQLTLDDIRGATGAAWTPMPVTPAATLSAGAPAAVGGEQPASGSTRFTAGQSARNMTNSRVNIRMTPGYLGKGASDVIGQLEAGQTLEILGEPTLADELTWWRVQAQSNGQQVVGWVAESTSSGVQILGSAP